ncbi:hypothetical protein ACHAXN_010145 [Cyclotella atomus]
MKLSLPSILLLYLVTISKGEGSGTGPIAISEAAPTEVPVEVTTEDAPDGDAGKECAADDCGAAAAASSIEDAASSTEGAASSSTEGVSPEEEDPSCPSRPHVIRCAAKYLDTNQNGVLERSELESVMQTVPWLLRGLLNIFGSVDSIMKKCDADGDGSITIDVDMEETKETCLATCFKRKAFKKLFFPDCTE